MSKKKNAATVWGDLTYNQFRNAGRRGLEMSDVAWAGRMYSKMPYWNARLNRFTTVLLAVSVLCLAVMWVSVLMRKPALLLGVYPDGEVVCFPRLRTNDGQISPVDASYQGLCTRIDERIGKKWQTTNAESVSDNNAIGNIEKETTYALVKDIEERVKKPVNETVPSPVQLPVSPQGVVPQGVVPQTPPPSAPVVQPNTPAPPSALGVLQPTLQQQ